MIKTSAHLEEIIIKNIYVLDIRAPEYINQELLDVKGEIDYNTTIVGNFHPSLSQWTDHSDRKSIRKQDLNCTSDQMYLIHKCQTYHPIANIFFSSTYRIYCRRDHMLVLRES